MPDTQMYLSTLLLATAVVGCAVDAAPEEPGGDVFNNATPLSLREDADAAAPDSVEGFEGVLRDPARDRTIGYRVYNDPTIGREKPLILLSHGGQNVDDGERYFPFLGAHFAGHGYVVVALGHRPSGSGGAHELDRPADVSFVLDVIENNEDRLRRAFGVDPDLDHVGIYGHSWGAYTASAIEGAMFSDGKGDLSDPRVDAVIAVSLAGPGSYGFYEGSWDGIDTPTYNLVGECEARSNERSCSGDFQPWRFVAYDSYPAGDKYLTLLPGADHSDMYGGPGYIRSFLQENGLAFFDTYLRRQNRREEIGGLAVPDPSLGTFMHDSK